MVVHQQLTTDIYYIRYCRKIQAFFEKWAERLEERIKSYFSRHEESPFGHVNVNAVVQVEHGHGGGGI